MTIRVAVIDDDDITRWGTTAILDAHDGIDVVLSTTHTGAVGPWDEVDVALVDAADTRRVDQFPGVGVVEAIVAANRRCVVIVLTGVLLDDVVRRRMREAGAHLYFHRSELRDAATLHALVLGRLGEQPVPAPADSEAMHRLGITPATRVNAALAASDRLGMVPGSTGAGGRSRAQVRRRVEFNQEAHLAVVTADGRPPDRDQAAPSLPQIDRFLRWATRVRDADDG